MPVRKIQRYKNNNIAKKEQIRLKRGNWIQRRSKLQGRLNHISNPALVKIRNLLVKKISRNAVKSAHSYDADKETIKRMKA